MARRALSPATLAVVQAIEVALEPVDQALLVACSGGADSLALTAATAQVLRRRGLPGSALVVDHGLQSGSAAVAERTREQVLALGITAVEVARVEVDRQSGLGIEASARNARYAVLDEAAQRADATVLLGHTLDDQAETVLLGLARGSGTRSLAGMAVRSGRLLRPLLALRRAVLEQVCVDHGIRPWHDPSNDDDEYARSRVRSHVLPVLERELGPGIAESLSRTAQLARDDADLLETLASGAHPDTDTLDCVRLAVLPPALRRRVILRWLRGHGGPEVSFIHVVKVEELVTEWHGQAGVDLPGVRVIRSDGRLACQG